MIRHAFSFLAGCVLAFATSLPAQTLTLADGQVLLAKVEEATGDGVRVVRLDNGGMLELTWGHLATDCATRIKQAYNLVATDVDELTVQATEVFYTTAGGNQSVVGRVVSNDGATILVVNKGVSYPIPRKDLRGAGMRTIEVPVTQVYTRDEFYQARLQELAPGDDADKHVVFAEELLRVRDYANAKNHLEIAKQKATSRDPAKLDGLLERVKLYIEAKKERDLLDEIQILRQRGEPADFDKGLQLIARFDKEYPNSKLKAAFETEKKTFTEARGRELTERIAMRWRAVIRDVANTKVADEEFGWEAAKEYATSTMGDDIAARVAPTFKLPVEEVKQLFAGRGKYPAGKRAEMFAYGLGSWTLGDAAILKDTKQGQDQTERQPKNAAQDRDIEKIAAAIRKARERARASQGQGEQDAEPTEEDWWRSATRTERVGWLAAYYAEFSGQMTLTIATTEPCVTCFGQGTIAEVGTDGKVAQAKCYLCHGKRWLRRFKAW